MTTRGYLLCVKNPLWPDPDLITQWILIETERKLITRLVRMFYIKTKLSSVSYI